MWKGPVHGIELFNDFTYSLSYNSELSATVIDDPNFVIPCYNGENFHIIFNKSTILQYLSKKLRLGLDLTYYQYFEDSLKWQKSIEQSCLKAFTFHT